MPTLPFQEDYLDQPASIEINNREALNL